MKKFFSTLIILAVISTAMVAKTKMLSVNFAIPLDTVTTKAEISSNYPGLSGSGSSKLNTTSIGFGISGLNMFNNLIGLYSDVEFGILQSGKREDFSFKRKDFGNDYKQFAMNFMMGPAFKILENDKMLFTAAPAFHWFMNYESNSNYAFSGGMIGLGGNASFSYFFNDVIGITAGMDMAFDFLGYGDYKKQEDRETYGSYYATTTTKYTHFNFTPKFGVSFKF